MRRAFKFAFVLYLISFATVHLGIWLGRLWIPPGDGFVNSYGIRQNLFRFDSTYYFSIATSGYAYTGDAFSSPNIVFAPLFPILIWTLSWIPGLDELCAGFLINVIFLNISLALLFVMLEARVGRNAALATLVAMVTSAGSYAFHAYYSESTMLLTLSGLLFFLHRRAHFSSALSAALLGASRLAALPFSIVTMFYLMLQAARDKKAPFKLWLSAMICPLGLALYLGYIGAEFGNPFRIFPEIQNASWGYFHPDVPFYFLLGPNLISFFSLAASKGFATFGDIKTLNLVWTLLALSSVVYWLWRGPRDVFYLLFGFYFLFVYYTGAGSEFLISAHRFYALMIPLFLMCTDLCQRLIAKSRPLGLTVSGLLMLLNFAYSLFHAACFNQGVWYFF